MLELSPTSKSGERGSSHRCISKHHAFCWSHISCEEEALFDWRSPLCHVELSYCSGLWGHRDAPTDLTMAVLSRAQIIQADLKDHYGGQPMQRTGLAHNIRSVDGEPEDVIVADNATGPTRITCPLQTGSLWKRLLR